MSPHSPKTPSGDRGFTLVEVMVAMVIGMIGIVIMMQVFATAEGQKRATTGTGDAQSTGATALYELQRDIRQGGYGLNSLSLLSCGLVLPSGATLPTLGPAIINPRKADASLLLPAGDANTDTLLIGYGSGAGSSEGDAITNPNGTILAVQTAANFVVGDAVIAAPVSDGTVACALTLTLDRVTAVATPWVTIGSTPAVPGGLLFNIGQAPAIRAYAIRGGNLTVCDYLANDCGNADNVGVATIWRPIDSNIVSLRAQYGHNNTNPITWDQTTPTTACQWVQTSALRIAVVARNSQVDKYQITASAPTWEGSAALPFDLSARANWQNYRYKVFETVVPIRNLPWMAKC